MAGVIDLEAQADLIRSVGADVVFLQEVDCATVRSGGVDQAAYLAGLAGYRFHAFGRTRDCQDGSFGNAILSRFSPVQVTNSTIPIPDPEVPRRWRDGSLIHVEPRGLLRFTADVNGRTAHFLCTHFGFLDGERPASARFVAAIVRSLSGPVIVGGDLNAYDESAEELVTLRESMTDCALSTGIRNAATFPSNDPRLRLDYLMVRGACAPISTSVVLTDLSDHCVLVADLELVPEPVRVVAMPLDLAGAIPETAVAAPSDL